jgi:hypothetical protein
MKTFFLPDQISVSQDRLIEHCQPELVDGLLKAKQLDFAYFIFCLASKKVWPFCFFLTSSQFTRIL